MAARDDGYQELLDDGDAFALRVVGRFNDQ